ncbi:hypothetical protein D3C78_466660 [compost metagenome]
MLNQKDEQNRLKKSYNTLLNKKREIEESIPSMQSIDTVFVYTNNKKIGELLDDKDLPDNYKEIVNLMRRTLDEIESCELDEALHGFIVTEYDKELFNTLQSYGVSDYQYVISAIKVLKIIKANTPKIEKADIDSFAEKTADELINKFSGKTKPEGWVIWKKVIMGLSINIIYGVIGSGMYDLIRYLGGQVITFGAVEHEEAATSHATQNAEIYQKLITELCSEDRKNFDYISNELRAEIHLMLAGDIGRSIELNDFSSLVSKGRGLGGVSHEEIARIDKKIIHDYVLGSMIEFLSNYKNRN